MRVLVATVRPAALVETLHGSLQDLEHEFDVGGATIDDGEGVEPERGGHFASHVARRARRTDDDRGRGRLEAAKDVKDARAGLVGRRAVIQREAEIDDGDMDGRGSDDLFGLTGGSGLQRGDAERLEEGSHAVGPGIRSPTSPRKEEVEPGGFLPVGERAGTSGRRSGVKMRLSWRGMCVAGGHT